MSAKSSVPAIPAATLVVFRRAPQVGPPEILMVERSASLAFAGGAAVFPGGRIDPADYDFARRLGASDDDSLADTAARIAAIRETLEETGLLVGAAQTIGAGAARRARALLDRTGNLAAVLDAMGWTLDVAALLPFARWRPDHAGMRNFDTRFYLADLGTGAVDLAVDRTENTHLFWSTAQGALDLAAAGQIELIFPTRRNLERLAQFGEYAAARDHVARFPSRLITPRVEVRDGVKRLCIPADAGYPVTFEALEDVRRN
jgi:8-oxo-dGTP pyrophosphatase MutT (NUDIX family)